MLRTALCSFSLAGVSLSRSFWPQVHAKEDGERPVVTSYLPEKCEDVVWMAEPLTDSATREKTKDDMKTRMELMVMKVG